MDDSGEAARQAAEKALVTGLTKLLGRPVADVSSAEPLIAARLKATGLFSQEGRTGVLHDLMIWSRETHKVEQVALPEGGQRDAGQLSGRLRQPGMEQLFYLRSNREGRLDHRRRPVRHRAELRQPD